ncbi:MAG TPA: hypothetical protein DCS07_04245 [Bdellovibrionales bacterium]|nr:MAG: hypothetical protein A2Z97_06415 [Bdellovibrionales bacterium GWB1_52_6]OFZ02504.1 MAG: hypothetical protein A2X97_07530 [Bdellovibrionales bacterium GWA1_52_35]OFZ40332.1 MAG: hypothetical protein A2070_11685 [Bdellovibrionales bacterium GWC1_52_8]HAR41829.1 hypothetical protein [Bdellovibrionales bacterium]HCM41349.1 hypothetical protein [Bdellovibrionales bacterium]
MVPECVEKANRVLSEAGEGGITREKLVAFSTISAFCHHYPSRSTELQRNLLNQFSWIREREMSRYLKQRRIALVHIQNQLNVS